MVVGRKRQETRKLATPPFLNVKEFGLKFDRLVQQVDTKIRGNGLKSRSLRVVVLEMASTLRAPENGESGSSCAIVSLTMLHFHLVHCQRKKCKKARKDELNCSFSDASIGCHLA